MICRELRRLANSVAALVLCVHCSSAASPPDAYPEQAQQAFEQAQMAMQQGQWPLAELLLERTLMLQPEHAQAMIEMAHLLALSGRAEGSLALVNMLLQDPRTPIAHQQRLQLLAQDLLAQVLASAALIPAPAALSAAAGIEVAWGHSTNPLAAANVSDIILTPPSGPVSLRLGSQPQPAASLGLAADWKSPQGYVAILQWQQVALPQASPGARLVLQGPLGLGAPQAGLHWQVHTQHYPDGSQRHQVGLGGSSPQSAWLMGRYAEPQTGRRGWLLRTQQLMLSTPHWSALVGAEAESSLAGASAPPGAVRANARVAYRPSAHWQWTAHWQGHADTSAYSPLLADGAPRRMHTLQLNAERQLGDHWVLRLHAARRWANVPLFGWADAGVQLAWTTRW